MVQRSAIGHFRKGRSQHPQRLGFTWLGTQQPLRQTHDCTYPAGAQKPERRPAAAAPAGRRREPAPAR